MGPARVERRPANRLLAASALVAALLSAPPPAGIESVRPITPSRAATASGGLPILRPGLAPAASRKGGAVAPPPAAEISIINFIGHESTDEMTRVILHASGPIDYRGGALHGGQVILDLANVGTALPSPVVEIGTPEVDRVVIGPEITRDGTRLLKVRLTGVRARSHRVRQQDNELLIDLTALRGGRGGKGLPKVIRADEPSHGVTVQARPGRPASLQVDAPPRDGAG